jgi:hypothetical protein
MTSVSPSTRHRLQQPLPRSHPQTRRRQPPRRSRSQSHQRVLSLLPGRRSRRRPRPVIVFRGLAHVLPRELTVASLPDVLVPSHSSKSTVTARVVSRTRSRIVGLRLLPTVSLPVPSAGSGAAASPVVHTAFSSTSSSSGAPTSSSITVAPGGPDRILAHQRSVSSPHVRLDHGRTSKPAVAARADNRSR